MSADFLDKLESEQRVLQLAYRSIEGTPADFYPDMREISKHETASLSLIFFVLKNYFS